MGAIKRKRKNFFRKNLADSTPFRNEYLTRPKDTNIATEISIQSELAADCFFVQENQEEEEEEAENISLNYSEINPRSNGTNLELIFKDSIQKQNPFLKEKQIQEASDQMLKQLARWTEILQKYSGT